MDEVYFEALLADRSEDTSKAAVNWVTSRGITVDFAGKGAYSISCRCSNEIFAKLEQNNPCEYIIMLEPQKEEPHMFRL